MSAPSWGRRPSFAVAVVAAAALAATAASAAALMATRPRDGHPAVSTRSSPAGPGRRPPPTPTTTSTPATPNPPRPTITRPEQVAAAFAAAFLTFRWDDPADGLRRRCRPWDTDAVDAALAGPWVPPDRDRRAANHETDQVAIHAVNPQDRAADRLDASVAATVTLTRPGRPTQVVQEFLDLQVALTPRGWAVDEVSQ